MTKYSFDYHGQTVYSAKLDIVFKALFTGGEDLSLLASFLSAILGLDLRAEDLIVLNTELPPSRKYGKQSKLDIRVLTADNKHIDIEIQLIKKKNLVKRFLFYLARLYTRQLKARQSYESLGAVIVIGILDFALLPDGEYHNIYRMKNTRTGEELTDIFELNFIELPKVPPDLPGGQKNMWMRFLSAMSEEELDMLAKKDKAINKAVRTLAAISAEEQLQYELEMIERAELDYRSDMIDSEQQGLMKGIQQGVKQGVRKGALRQKREAAIRMKREGFTDEMISHISGLPIEKVRAIEQP